MIDGEEPIKENKQPIPEMEKEDIGVMEYFMNEAKLSKPEVKKEIALVNTDLVDLS